MAVKMLYEDEARWILHAMEILQQEWPELDLFRWAEGTGLKAQSEWIAANAHFWQVWNGGRIHGFIAAVDLGRGRWAVHFGNRRAFRSGGEMVAAWRKFVDIAASGGTRLLVAYIPAERPGIRRVARIFHFRRFSQTLWVLNPTHRNSNRRQRKRPG